MPAFPGQNQRRNWPLLLLEIFFLMAVVAGLGILYKDHKLQSLTQQTKPSVDDPAARNYSPAVSPAPPVSPVITALPLSSPNHYGTVKFYDNLNGETAWMEGMFTYVAKAGAAGKQNIKPEVVSGVVQDIEGDIFTIAPMPEIAKDYTGPPTISIRILPATAFWGVTYTPAGGTISKMTDKRKISINDVKIGDNTGFRDLDVSGGIITSLTVYDY